MSNHHQIKNFIPLVVRGAPTWYIDMWGVECPEMLITPMGTHLQGFYEPPTSVLSEKQVFAPIMSHWTVSLTWNIGFSRIPASKNIKYQSSGSLRIPEAKRNGLLTESPLFPAEYIIFLLHFLIITHSGALTNNGANYQLCLNIDLSNSSTRAILFIQRQSTATFRNLWFVEGVTVLYDGPHYFYN